MCIRDSTWPGVGPNRYHPGSWKSVGTWTVPSGLSPSSDTATATPMAGILSVTGVERATTLSGAGPVVVVVLVVDAGCSGRCGRASETWWPRRPTAIKPTATTSSTLASTHQCLDRRLPCLGGVVNLTHPRQARLVRPARGADAGPGSLPHLLRAAQEHRERPTHCHRSEKLHLRPFAERPK